MANRTISSNNEPTEEKKEQFRFKVFSNGKKILRTSSQQCFTTWALASLVLGEFSVNPNKEFR